MANNHTYEREESTRGRRDTSKAMAIRQPTLRTPTIQILPPPAIYDAAVVMGVEKANMPWWVHGSSAVVGAIRSGCEQATIEQLDFVDPAVLLGPHTFGTGKQQPKMSQMLHYGRPHLGSQRSILRMDFRSTTMSI
jgi:hypothetical protein